MIDIAGSRLYIELYFGRFLFSCFSFHLSYEPELFPGLIYRVMQPKIVLLIFNSGKVVLTGKMQEYIDLAFMNKIVYRDLGAKERRQIYEAFELIFPILKTFRRAS